MWPRGTVRTPDGTDVAYQVEADGHPVLVLTGQANNHHWWDVVWPELAAYRTVSIDWRGTGDSADGPADFTTRSSPTRHRQAGLGQTTRSRRSWRSSSTAGRTSRTKGSMVAMPSL
jgi:pimeloyl-ACP methyl ester carboxylesterase